MKIAPLFFVMGTFFSLLSFAKLDFELVVPTLITAGQKYPLLVVIHGCDQDGQDMKELVQIEKNSAQQNFFVLYPSQSRLKNPINCWNWFDPQNQGAQGETLFIHDLVQTIKLQNQIDANRIFVMGISSGGAIASILMTYYSPFYKAAAIHSAPSFFSADTLTDAVQLMKFGKPQTKKSPLGPILNLVSRPLLIIQGLNDKTVHPNNAILLKSDFEQIGHRSVKLELLKDLDHAWAEGNLLKKYSQKHFYNSSKQILNFFGLD